MCVLRAPCVCVQRWNGTDATHLCIHNVSSLCVCVVCTMCVCARTLQWHRCTSSVYSYFVFIVRVMYSFCIRCVCVVFMYSFYNQRACVVFIYIYCACDVFLLNSLNVCCVYCHCSSLACVVCVPVYSYGVATVSRIDKILGLFCRILSLL